jgi:hypothetical protein
VDIPDFEVSAELRARVITVRTAPDPLTRRDETTLERSEQRLGLPNRVEDGETYREVVVQKSLLARLRRS